MQKRLIPAVVLPLLVSTFVYATDDTVAPIIVTATRTAQTADETLASVTVITRDQIDHSQAQSIQDLLVGVPGLELSNSGGAGKTTSVYLRGANSDHVLVLIDGIKVGSATLGTTAFENIPVDQVERIEIVRGPRSSLYGSEAIGGVIQIFTRKGGGPTTPFLSVGAGSYRTYNASAGVSGGGKRGWYSLSASDDHTAGINACRGSLTAGCFTVEPDKDGYRNASGTLRAGYRFDNGADVDVHWLHSNGFTKYDGNQYSGNEAKPVQDVLGGQVGFSPLVFWHASLATGRSEDHSDGFLNGAFLDRFNTQRDNVAFQNDFTVDTNQLVTLGVDYLDDKVSGVIPQYDNNGVQNGTSNYSVTSRSNKGLFAQYQGTLDTQDVQASLRRDDNAQFGGYTTGGLAWGHTFSNQLRLTGSYGTAFKAPTFNELYYPNFGNPDLKPENSHSVELGVSGKYAIGRWSISAYQTNVNQLIIFDPNNNYLPSNVSLARIRGLETVFSTRLLGCAFNTNLTLLDPEDRSDGANHGNILPRRAKETLSVDLDRTSGRYRFGTTLFVSGKRYEDPANTQALGGYTTVDLRAEYAFARDWTLAARAANVLNKSYETAAYYNQPGRNYFLTLRYQPANH